MRTNSGKSTDSGVCEKKLQHFTQSALPIQRRLAPRARKREAENGARGRRAEGHERSGFHHRSNITCLLSQAKLPAPTSHTVCATLQATCVANVSAGGMLEEGHVVAPLGGETL